jgi:hypothetical protein
MGLKTRRRGTWYQRKGPEKKCKSDVHQAVIKSLHSIFSTKRKLEKPKEENWHRRKSTKVS